MAINKLQAIKIKKQMKDLQNATEQCAEFLTSLQSHHDFDSAVQKSLNATIQHQKNMMSLFGQLQQQI